MLRGMTRDYLLVSIILRHDCFFNLLIYSLPYSRHVNYWPGAYWATELVMLYHLLVALAVHGMPTFHNCCVFQRVEEILIAYGTMMPHRILHTQMIVKKTHWIARATFLAVEKVLPTTNSADSTVITMELSFIDIIIIELAHFTKIFSHPDATVCTNMSNLSKRETNSQRVTQSSDEKKVWRKW